MRAALRANLERVAARGVVERAFESAGPVGMTLAALLEETRPRSPQRVRLALAALTREGVLIPIRPPTGGHPVAWRHRDHATEAERAEADRRPSQPPSLFGADGGNDAT